MTLALLPTILLVFLCTYLVHSTLLLTPVWWLVAKRRWPADPELQSQLLKLSLTVPLVTTLTVSALGGPHWGLKIPLDHRGGQSTSNDEAAGVGVPASDLEDYETARTLSQQVGNTIPESAEISADEQLVAMAAVQPAEQSSALDWRRVCVPVVAFLWLTIVAAGLIRLTIEWASLQQLRRAATAIVDPDLLDELERLRREFGIQPRVALFVSSQTAAPMAAGIIRPFIVFPKAPSAGSGFSAMLAHELAHVARRDALWNLLLQVVCRVCFFQPLNWLASHVMRQQMDFTADSMAAKVLGERMSLVRCLYATGKRLSGHRASPSSVFVLASGMALFQSTLGQRIEALLNTEQAPLRPSSLTRATVLLLTLLAALSVSLLGPRAVVEAAPPSKPSLPDRNDQMNKSIASMLVLAGLSMPATADEPKSPPASAPADTAPLSTTPDELPAGIRRFNGMLVGRVAAKDVEQGSFTVLVDAVPRVWENSRAEAPRSIVGKTIKVSGVFGKFLDVLVVTRIGETVEFECKHDGEGLVFPGELLRKVAPYDPADYPVLPEEFRGFRGQVAAEILKKDPETFELILRVERVLKTSEENTAKEPKSIEGKSLMLAGFWNRRDAYHDLKVGDRIEVGMRHIGPRSDHLTVAETVKRIAAPSARPADGPDRETRDGAESMEVQRGFRGMLVGRLVEKDVERGTFTITVDAVPRVWENNRAANPKALIGKNVSAEGVTGRMLDALVVAKVGDTIEFGALHEEGPRVRVGEVLHKVAAVKPGDYPVLPDEFRGFRGMVTAKVVRKGDALWELIVEVEEVGETFEGSRAKKPESIVGKQAMLAGFWNRKDEFHNIREGDRIRCGMNHTQLLSDHLTVIESIRKVDER